METVRRFFAITILAFGSILSGFSQGNCLDFDGINDYVTVAHSSTLNLGTNDFTVEFWIKTSQSSGYADILGKYSGSTGWGLYLDAGKIYLQMNSGLVKVIDGTVADGSWHHVAVVKTSTTVGRPASTYHYVTGYLDGAKDNEGQFTHFSSTDNSGALGLGEWYGYGDYLEGKLEEVRIWNEERTEAQIQSNMYDEVGSTDKVAYWKLNESSGTTMSDETSNGNDGTLVNFALSGSASNWINSDVPWTIVSQTSGFWNNTSTWNTGTIPNSNNTVEIDHTVAIQGDRSVKELKINSGGTITVKHNGSLTVGSGGLTNSSNGTFEILSDVAGNVGSLVFTGGGTASGSGSFKLSREMVVDEWHTVSSPIASASVWIFAPAAVYKYDEPNQEWDALTGGSLEVMKGYQLYCHGTSSNTVVFNGTFNSGTQSISLTASGDGFNLVGNPYPSSIDWEAVTIPSNVNSAIYVYDPGLGSVRTYVQGGGTVPGYSNTTSRYIPATQAFFVKCTGSATLELTESARTIEKEIFRENQETPTNEIRIGLTGHNNYDETLVRFVEQASYAFDGKYDGYKMFSSDVTASQLFVRGDDGLDLSISSIPYSESTYTMPLYTDIKVAGEYKLNLDISRYEENYNIFLEDKLSGEVLDFRKDQTYTFEGDPQQDNDRFVLYLVPLYSISGELSGIEESIEKESKVFAGNKKVYISMEEQRGEVRIYNLMGKEVYFGKVGKGVSEIPFNEASGVYVVKITRGLDVNTQKIYLR